MGKGLFLVLTFSLVASTSNGFLKFVLTSIKLPALNNTSSINNNCTLTFNPIYKRVEALEENKKLYEQFIAEKKRLKYYKSC